MVERCNRGKYIGTTVLLTEGESRQTLPMAKAFQELGCTVITVQEKKSDLGNVTRYADKKYVIPEVNSSREKFIKEHGRIIRNEHIDLIVPLSDFSAGILAQMKSEVEAKFKTKIASNDLPVFMKAYDKLNTMKACSEYDIPCPYTVDAVFTIDDVPLDLKYPVISKPRSASGSVGLHFAGSRAELAQHIDRSKAEGLGDILVQEFIPQTGKQYNAHFLFDDSGEARTAILTEKCRWFPVDGGASTLCRTIHDGSILEICAKLLKKIGWIGYCDLDLMEDPRDGSVKVIEINARISANVKICFAAGVNIAEQLLQLYFGEKVASCLEYKDDIRLRCMHTDLLWLLKSPNRFKSEPSWFSVDHTTDQIFSWSDLPVFFAFSFQALKKYHKEMEKRKR